MKACVFAGIVFAVAACSTMVSAAPAPSPESLLVPRARNAAKEALKKLLPAAEKAVLNPSSMTDRDQRKENRDNAIKIVTGTEDKVSTNRRHPELQKVMDEARKNVFKPSNNK